MTIPDDLKYTADHEWAKAVDGGAIRVGITHHAQESLGDVVYVTLPEVGATLDVGAPFGEVESTKSVSDLLAPIAGTVHARNDALSATPELVNSDPYGDGWMVEISPGDPDALGSLLDAAAYRDSLGT